MGGLLPIAINVKKSDDFIKKTRLHLVFYVQKYIEKELRNKGHLSFKAFHTLLKVISHVWLWRHL